MLKHTCLGGSPLHKGDCTTEISHCSEQELRVHIWCIHDHLYSRHAVWIASITCLSVPDQQGMACKLFSQPLTRDIHQAAI